MYIKTRIVSIAMGIVSNFIELLRYKPCEIRKGIKESSIIFFSILELILIQKTAAKTENSVKV